MFNIISLQRSNVKAYESLTYQHLQHRVSHIDEDSRLIAFGAEFLSEPVGLIVIDVFTHEGFGEILTLFVKKDYRKMGIGKALLSKAEEVAHQVGCKYLKAFHYSGKKVTPIIETFLRKEGWSKPVERTLIYKTDMQSIAQAPWLKGFTLPKNTTVFHWSELSQRDRKNIRDVKSLAYPPYLSPFINEEKIESYISLGLRVEDQVSGWNIVHKVAEDTLLYNGLFVQSDYQHLGCSMVLLTSSIKLQLEKSIPYGMFAVSVDNHVMKRLIERWLQPYAINKTTMYLNTKSIT